MNELDLKTKIEGLEKAIKEHQDFVNTYSDKLTTTKQELVDLNKPELTPIQMDNIWEAVNDAVADFCFDDSDNYEFEYELDYDGRVNCSGVDFQSGDQLVDKIVVKIQNLFKEADCPEEEPTADQLNTQTVAEKVI